MFLLIKTELFHSKAAFLIVFSSRKPRFRVLEIKFLFFLIKTDLFHCKTAFLIVLPIENLVFEIKFLFFLIKTIFSTVKTAFPIFFTRKHRFRGKISVFPDNNHLFHCKTEFLIFFQAASASCLRII